MALFCFLSAIFSSSMFSYLWWPRGWWLPFSHNLTLNLTTLTSDHPDLDHPGFMFNWEISDTPVTSYWTPVCNWTLDKYVETFRILPMFIHFWANLVLMFNWANIWEVLGKPGPSVCASNAPTDRRKSQQTSQFAQSHYIIPLLLQQIKIMDKYYDN